MFKNTAELDQFYKRLVAKEKMPYRKALSLYEALYREALSLGIFRSGNLLDGLEVDLRIARILNQRPR